MPRKDRIHEAVRNALVKEGRTITEDSFCKALRPKTNSNGKPMFRPGASL